MAEKKLGRYQQKRRLGLVPYRYDRESKPFKAGAWRNWEKLGLDPSRPSFQNQVTPIVNRDSDLLTSQREAR